ncbi:cytochrome P450 CYP94D108-like [Humulus lupulus]|uniref:cytochrome P450 CYP94D108-like n=1 Tax=Humulus lupulus TaxID=3486 RepID=UPI002B4178DE|nr:cytochrome P450 CYP94D108-like [Humulus lupulus]
MNRRSSSLIVLSLIVSMELFSSLTPFFFLLFSIYIFVHIYQTRPKKPNVATSTIIIKSYLILGHLLELIKNRNRILDWFTDFLRQNPKNTVVLKRPFNKPTVETANPLNVEHLAKTNFENYPKGDFLLSLLGELLGGGIFNSDGDRWKMQRKAVSHEFSTKSLRNFVLESVVVEIETRLLPILEKASETGQTIDLQDVLERFAFDNICKLAFDVDPGCLCVDGADNGGAANEFVRAFAEAVELSSARFMEIIPLTWKIKRFLNVGSEKRLKQLIATVHKFADSIIKSRKDEKNTKGDLLSRFIGDDGLNSPEFLRDIVTNIIIAGRDTTTAALSWFFWLISSRPEIQQNILKELELIRARTDATNFSNNTYSFDQIRDMQYLHAAITESMRLYPPLPVDSRLCLNDDVWPDGTLVGKGTVVSFHPYAMGRMESIWGENRLEFQPERWLADGVFRPENPFRYPVFHAGPRTCLGKEMAYIQMKSIAASVLGKFEVDVLNRATCPEHLLVVTLRMKGGLPVKISKRSV